MTIDRRDKITDLFYCCCSIQVFYLDNELYSRFRYTSPYLYYFYISHCHLISSQISRVGIIIVKYFSSSWLVGWLIELKEISKIVSGEIENLCQDRD